MRRNDSSPEAYRKDVLGEQTEMLETMREAVFEVAPDMEEIIESGMLGFPGVTNLAAQKHHVALYIPPGVLAEHRDRFPGTDCGKSCMRFRRSNQIDPEQLRTLLRAVLRARSE